MYALKKKANIKNSLTFLVQVYALNIQLENGLNTAP